LFSISNARMSAFAFERAGALKARPAAAQEQRELTPVVLVAEIETSLTGRHSSDRRFRAARSSSQRAAAHANAAISDIAQLEPDEASAGAMRSRLRL
jgi:hypothetical protein